MFFSKFCRLFLKEILILFLGLIIVPFLTLALILSIPFLIYRWGLYQWAKWFCQGELGKPVTVHGSNFAVEFLPSNKSLPTRYAIGIQAVVDGKVTIEEVEELLSTKLLGTNSIYPELKQYVECWIGYMFWKPDLDFHLKNHIKIHNLFGEKSDHDDSDVEQKVCMFVEELTNKRFTPKRSPWEVHLIPNYRQMELGQNEMTLIIIRLHHCLADGYSLLSMFMEGLLDTPLSALSLPTPEKILELTSFGNKVKFAITLLFRFPYDFAHFTALVFHERSFFYTPDEKRECPRLYGRSELIPVQQIKEIKNKLGVSFTGVVLTAISAAMAKTLSEKGGKKNTVEKTPIAFILPLPGHTKKLRNQWTASYLEFPTSIELDSMKRLHKVEKLLKNARTSTVPLFLALFYKSVGFPLARITKFVAKNRFAPAVLSSFPGPDIDIFFNGKKILLADALMGIGDGVLGIGFLLLTFRNHIRIAATAVDGVLDRKELKTLLGYVQNEFDNLQKLANICSHPGEDQGLFTV